MTRRDTNLLRQDIRAANRRWGRELGRAAHKALRFLFIEFGLRVISGDLLFLDNGWYVTHTGLLRIARRQHCAGIRVQPVHQFCEPSAERWAFQAIVLKSRTCKGFVGYGDANPSNVSPLVRGAEMRVAETRAVNRALRKAYGIGICSVEELGSSSGSADRVSSSKRFAPQSTGNNGNRSGQPKLRDQLCLLIRQHRLDAALVKRFATDFCAVSDLRQASREQVEALIKHLGEFASKDPGGLAAKLASYAEKQESAGAA